MAESITRKNIDLDILDYYDGKIKNYVDDKVGTGSITIDDTLSDTSTNPVQNKVVKQAIDNKADKSLYGDTTINVGRESGTTVGKYSTAEGYSTTASGLASHAEGYNTTASKTASHAEGAATTASGSNAHAEGGNTTASGDNSHAEGNSNYKVTQLITDFSGNSTTNDDIINAWNTKKFSVARGKSSHVEGQNNLSLGHYSHAEGLCTVATGNQSHTSGYYTKALHDNEAAYGEYNESNDDTLFSIGDGTADDARHNAFEITTTGGKLHDKDIATTDLIPTSLPANGGNADTVGGIQISDIRQITKTAIQTLPTSPSAEGDYFVSLGDSSFPYTYGNLSIRYGSYTGEFVAIYQTTGDDQNIWFNVYRGGWTGWKRINDGGNADMLDSHHEDYFAKASNPTIEGEMQFVRSGNMTTKGTVFGWEDTIRIRNQDVNAENTTYADLIVTPLGLFTERMLNGAIAAGREKLLTQSDIPTYVENAGNADTVDGLHANDFTKIIDFGYTETDTKTAIGQSAKTTIYRCVNWTDFPIGLPDGQGSIISISYSGTGTAGTDQMWCAQIFISAHGPIFIRNVANIFVGSWEEIYPSSSKPYLTGVFTLSGNESKTITLGFTPSYVDVRGDATGYNINVEARITTNGFTAIGLELTQNAAVRYIAFR